MKKLIKTTLFSIFGLLVVACSNTNSQAGDTSEPEPVSAEPVSVDISKLPNKLESADGMVINFDNKGAKIDSIYFDNIKIAENGFIAGRCANRIANATFELNGQTYNLDKNNGQHHLHGGSRGFGELNWNKVAQTDDSISFSLTSPDGDMGYPGNMEITVKYALNEYNELSIEYNATTDADTLINPINHLYFELNGASNTSGAKNHNLWIDADKYTPVDSGKIPTGEIANVTTKYDFRTTKAITPNTFDDNFVLNGEGFRKVASMYGTTTNIGVDVYTDRPGLQVYNTNSQICLETQNFPDAIHHDNFPSPILRANENFYSKTVYAFSR